MKTDRAPPKQGQNMVTIFVNIENISLILSHPLVGEDFAASPGSYICVSRSVFEDDSGEHKCTSSTIRSEMLLGVMLIRPVTRDDHGLKIDGVDESFSELTTITHVYSPGVPEVLAKRAAPNSAAGMLKSIQSNFSKK